MTTITFFWNNVVVTIDCETGTRQPEIQLWFSREICQASTHTRRYIATIAFKAQSVLWNTIYQICVFIQFDANSVLSRAL